MALYHKYRPNNFSELVGQDHIRQILTKALASKNQVHGYLFSGSRGLGKTTTARLLAKALNCEKSPAICSLCRSCQEIAQGRSLDVIEIDAASNRGIDEIRQLKETIHYSASQSRKKIYIIDEVHMLTKEAFNALLKTLEEPPGHVVFVLATTEPEKVPATILSRVQRFDFKRPALTQLADWIREVGKKEKKQLSGEAAQQLAALADGSYRDALMLFEQIAATESKITLDHITAVLGLPSQSRLNELLENLVSCRVKEALATINDLYQKGSDFGFVYKQLVLVLRGKVLDGHYQFSSLLASLLRASQEAKFSPLPQIPLEIAIGKYCQMRAEKPKQSRTENYPEKSVSEFGNPANSQDLSNDQWQKIIQEVRQYNHSLAGILSGGKVIKIDADSVRLGVAFSFYADRIHDPKNHQHIKQAAQKILGKDIKLICEIDQKLQGFTHSQDEDLYDQAAEIFS